MLPGFIELREFIWIIIDKKDEKLVKQIVSDKKIVLNNKEFDLDKIIHIEGEVIDHVRIYEYDGNGEKKFERILPIGYIRFIFRTGEKLEFMTINPIAKLDELVLTLNLIYGEKGLSKLMLIDSGATKNIYKRK